MSKKEKSRLGGFNLLGIPLDPTLGVGDKVLDHVDESIEAEKRKEAGSKYWARCSFYYTVCPKCSRKVITEELEEKGCFVCGYKPNKEE
ncbi:MAG: hypothetical protein Q7J67_01580 [bacterium]|nr:hypothetical protein [bacterium]